MFCWILKLDNICNMLITSEIYFCLTSRHYKNLSWRFRFQFLPLTSILSSLMSTHTPTSSPTSQNWQCLFLWSVVFLINYLCMHIIIFSKFMCSRNKVVQKPDEFQSLSSSNQSLTQNHLVCMGHFYNTIHSLLTKSSPAQVLKFFLIWLAISL